MLQEKDAVSQEIVCSQCNRRELVKHCKIVCIHRTKLSQICKEQVYAEDKHRFAYHSSTVSRELSSTVWITKRSLRHARGYR